MEVPRAMLQPGPWRVVLYATTACVVVGAFSWFRSRLSPDVAFGPWQGPLLVASPVQQVPLLSHWLSVGASHIPFGNAAWRLNVLSALFGALSCGLVCAISARVARKIVSAVEAVACGVLAGAAFAATPITVYVSTGAGPSTLTLFIGLTVVSLLVGAGERIEHSVRLYVAAWLSGLVMSNHAAFGLLFVVCVLALPAFGSMTRQSAVCALGCCAAFLAGAGVPVAYALAQGESLRQFLSHALLQPYPNLFDGRPSMAAFERLSLNLSPAFLVLAIAGMVLLFRPISRRYGILFAAIAVCMGPLLPAMTNQAGIGDGLRDDDAPLLLVLALVCAYGSWGSAHVVQLLPRGRTRSWVRASAVAGLIVLSVAAQWPPIPSRNHGLAKTLGEHILAGCPRDALLVSGDDSITSLLTAAQVVYGTRQDVAVTSSGSFVRSSWERRRLAGHLTGRVTLPDVFPPQGAGENWSKEQPVLFGRFLKERAGGAASASLVDLALWDFVKANYARRPLCFVGMNSPWLAARAAISGLVLSYPRLYSPSVVEPDAEVRKFIAGQKLQHTDPDGAHDLALLPIPLAAAARVQGQCEVSLRLAELAARLNPQAPEPRLIMARAEARRGRKQTALEHLKGFLLRAPPETDVQELRALIERDLLCYAREKDFLEVVQREQREGAPDVEARRKAAQALWETDELVVLAQGYDSVLRTFPKDVDALYQLAAACAQLGDLPRARDVLEQLLSISGVAPGPMAERLADDGRFVLLRTYKSGI